MQERTTCTVDGCERKPRTRFAEWCNTHYFRVRRTGSAGSAEIWDKRRTPCRVEDCDRLACGKGFCDRHIQRWRRWGDPSRVAPPATGPRHWAWSNHAIGYGTAHDRVRRARGSARNQTCQRCTNPARHWAYDHSDPNERQTHDGIPFSVDPNRYIPLCVPCHKRMDLARLEVTRGRRRTAAQAAASAA
jgi:hypothetical protein